VRWRRAIDEEDSVAVEVPDSWGLTGKVAVVTGGGAAGDGIGNGRAAAILLARAGVQVVVVDRDEALAQRTVTMIAEDGGVAIAVPADVTRAADCAAIVQTALERFGRLDLLDNNVGIGSRGTVLDETEKHWRRVMQVNVDSMFLMARHVIPAMRRQGGSAIVNVSSISALRPRGLTAYTVSKGAVIALTRALAVDHGREHIRVNCVAPGLGARPGGHRLGHWPRGALLAVGLRALHHGPHAGRRRWHDAHRTRARLHLGQRRTPWPRRGAALLTALW